MKLAAASALVTLALVLAFSTGSAPADPAGSRTPVLVELFTSEGCSSCPPADALLAELARSQPVARAEVVPLALHVDYWNRLGWADPYSSAAFSERQNDYAGRAGSGRVYTPQMIVDGGAELVGSDSSRARAAIAEAARAPKTALTLAVAAKEPRALAVTVDVSAPHAASGPADVLVAITEDHLESDVTRGENAGRKLSHVGVARHLTTLG